MNLNHQPTPSLGIDTNPETPPGNGTGIGTGIGIDTNPETPQGAALYAQRCQGCHNGVPPPVPRNISVTQMREAINRYPAMTAVRDISNNEVEAIAAYLSDARSDGGSQPSTGSSSNSSSDYFSFTTPLPTGQHIATQLNQIFNTVVNPNNKISQIIDEQFVEPVSQMGGAFSRNETPATHKPNSFSLPVWNPIRLGYIMNGCARILEIPSAISTVLSQLQINVNAPATELNIEKVYHLFFPERSADPEVLDSLRNIYIGAIQMHISPEDSWKLVTLPLCESAAGGAL